MIHLASIKVGLENAREDLRWFFWETVLKVVGGSLLLIPVLFVAVLCRVLWILL